MNSTSTDKRYNLPAPESTAAGVSQDIPDIFVPTAVQIERAQKLKRFNRFVIYLPLGVLAASAMGLLLYLLVLAIRPPFEDTRLFISGVADVILILFILPVVLIFGLILVGILGGAVYWRRSRQEEGKPSLEKQYGRFRLLLWKIDLKLSGVYRQLNLLMPKLANPVIKFNTTVTYINTRLARLGGRDNNASSARSRQ